ncbi:UDP-galactopyranose mutase [Geomonas paludis]|uniref:UDP-galactopyranose mutase n=1 Tax=Geomonas paludis TaxID=2740185 RepID=A0A6V8MQ73_9BACT|nr:UDP-galactopyranose mutase [Geomonas paludis]UPU36198.1 UDP-galactopyranose mutase [Geomonas paludis]GFO62190.1 UDP-galactopyranose mutase [Geomonas paludis]
MGAFDIVVVGAGISGSTLAERYACRGSRVLVLEKRHHIGGNCYDSFDGHGILVSNYGAHLFHTEYEDVWRYVNRFSAWYPYEHRVLARVDGKLVPIPVNITTVNTLFGLSLQSEAEMQRFLDRVQVKHPAPRNGEEAALARVGHVLYEKMFKHYTKKQWNKYPHELDASVLQRIPIRTNFDDRYFSDRFQALPVEGYTKLFEKMLGHPNIEVRLNTDYFDVRDTAEVRGCRKLFYAGPIDRFFDYRHSRHQKLQWRSIHFEWITLDREYFQENSVINYPDPADGEFTRIVEYKHFTRQKHEKTTISREYTTDEGDPYYPVPNPENDAIYRRYQEEADRLTDVHFVGRLANYKYFNMDQAFKNALDLFHSLEGDDPSGL